MGLRQCCFLREKDEQKDKRIQMIKDYLSHSEEPKLENPQNTEFRDIALSEAANISVQSLDDSHSNISV